MKSRPEWGSLCRTLSGGIEVKTKNAIRELLDELPDDCTLDDVLYHLYVLHSIENGVDDFDNGRTISHEQVAEELRRKWRADAARSAS